MDVSARSFLSCPIAVVSAATLALTPTVTPTVARLANPPASSAVQLTSAAEIFGPGLLDSAAVAAQSIGDVIEALYNAVEPWAAYGVDLLSWAVGWVVPIAPQLIFFYDLGESIVQSLVFNTADLLDGTVSFSEALSNIGTATTDAFNAFVTTEIGWIDSLSPPSPPLDPGALADVGTLFGLVP